MNMGHEERHAVYPWVLSSSSAGWRELCPFLDCPVPSVEYPKSFVTL
jgi:hypothetical protein